MSAIALALATLERLLRSGVREFVLCPGSRNTPLSLALAEADRAGSLRLHVRIDERSAAFLALGLAKGSGRPAAVCATSGTAVANFHPAVIEAATSHTPLVLLTANRPLGVLGTGANQTIQQLEIFGGSTRAAVHLDDRAPHAWAQALTTALSALSDSPQGPGPVQVDLGFALPLVPEALTDLALPGQSRTDPSLTDPALTDQSCTASALDDPSRTAPALDDPGLTDPGLTDPGLTDPSLTNSNLTAAVASPQQRADLVPTRLELPPRTLVVVAECEPELAVSAVSSALEAGFPVHIEAGSALAGAPAALPSPHGSGRERGALAGGPAGCLRAGTFLLRSSVVKDHRPEHLLIVGRPTLSRHIPALAAAGDTAVTVIANDPGMTNAMGTGSAAVPARHVQLAGTVDPEYAAAWRTADRRAAAVIDAQTAEVFDAGAVAAITAASAPDLLIVGSSNPIRDLDERAVRRPQRVVVNRGAAGIDGLVSTAIGAALADQNAAVQVDQNAAVQVDQNAAVQVDQCADGQAIRCADGQATRRADPRADARDNGPSGRTAVALLGDLAFLHDSTALMIGPHEPRPELTIVVVNNDGGAIFASLEQGAPAYAEHFERVFGTPHGVRISALCAATATPYQRCETADSLRAALGEATTGIRVIEVPVTRADERERRAAFARAVLAAADSSLS